MNAREFLASASRWRWALPALVAGGFVFALVSENYPVINSYTQFVLVTVGINIILSTSLNLVNGYMGEFSVGHAGFMSLGAYASAVLTTKWLPDTPWAFFRQYSLEEWLRGRLVSCWRCSRSRLGATISPSSLWRS